MTNVSLFVMCWAGKVLVNDIIGFNRCIYHSLHRIKKFSFCVLSTSNLSSSQDNYYITCHSSSIYFFNSIVFVKLIILYV